MRGNELLLVLPAISAVIYVASALLIQRSIIEGASNGAVNFYANLIAGLLFQPIWLFASNVAWEMAWMPALAAVTFSVGQILTFVALRHGDVSVATPLLGAKVLFTAVVSAVFFGDTLSLRWWIAAGAGSLGVILVTGATLRTLVTRLLRADAMAALGAAASFAITDVFVQRWAPVFGIAGFIPMMFGSAAVISSVLFLCRDGVSVIRVPPPARKPLVAGGTALGVQALGIATALSLYGNATAVNVVYASRSIWSVVITWGLIRFFHVAPSGAAPKNLRGRFIGSMLLFAALLVVLL